MTFENPLIQDTGERRMVPIGTRYHDGEIIGDDGSPVDTTSPGVVVIGGTAWTETPVTRNRALDLSPVAAQHYADIQGKFKEAHGREMDREVAGIRAMLAAGEIGREEAYSLASGLRDYRNTMIAQRLADRANERIDAANYQVYYSKYGDEEKALRARAAGEYIAPTYSTDDDGKVVMTSPGTVVARKTAADFYVPDDPDDRRMTKGEVADKYNSLYESGRGWVPAGSTPDTITNDRMQYIAARHGLTVNRLTEPISTRPTAEEQRMLDSIKAMKDTPVPASAASAHHVKVRDAEKLYADAVSRVQNMRMSGARSSELSHAEDTMELAEKHLNMMLEAEKTLRRGSFADHMRDRQMYMQDVDELYRLAAETVDRSKYTVASPYSYREGGFVDNGGKYLHRFLLDPETGEPPSAWRRLTGTPAMQEISKKAMWVLDNMETARERRDLFGDAFAEIDSLGGEEAVRKMLEYGSDNFDAKTTARVLHSMDMKVPRRRFTGKVKLGMSDLLQREEYKDAMSRRPRVRKTGGR